MALVLDGGTVGTVAEFWAWAFTDLRDNTFRGIFAEWLVGKLLSLPLTNRVGWDCYDLKVNDTRIEVKCSSYLQPWAQKRFSNPTYSRLLAQCWDEDTNEFAPADYNADLYVFCLQACQDADAWDALALDQWRFWILPRRVVKANGTKGLSQASVERLATTAYAFEQPLTARTFKQNVEPLLAAR
jgi:hypothetical protein